MGAEAAQALVALARFGLDERQRERVATLLTALREDALAPTAIRGEDALDAHVADALVALELDAVREASRLADLGSGSGFPGLALAIALPRARVSLVESNGRRCDFLARMCSAAGIGNATPVRTRAEEWLEGLGASDVTLARALAPQPVVLEYAAPLLRVGGTLVDWRGRRNAEEEAAAERAARGLGMERVEVRRVNPFEGALERHLHVFAKLRATPERFPRRAGMARKRPLGG